MQLVTAAEFARRAGLNRSSITRAIRRKIIPSIGGKVDLDNEDVKIYSQSAKFHSADHIPYEDRALRHPSLSSISRSISAPGRSSVGATAQETPDSPPSGGTPSGRSPYPALDAAEIDPFSPAVLDALDGLNDPHRIGLVERSAVVALVSALYSTLILAPVDDDGKALDPFDLARRLSAVFKDFLASALESDIDRVLAEAEAAARGKLEPKRPDALKSREE